MGRTRQERFHVEGLPSGHAGRVHREPGDTRLLDAGEGSGDPVLVCLLRESDQSAQRRRPKDSSPGSGCVMRRRQDPTRCEHYRRPVPSTCPCKPGCHCHHGRTCDRRRGARRGKQGGNAGRGSRWIGKALRRRIYERDGHTCVWCGAREPLSLDHVIPRHHGGTHASSNLVTSCGPCNAKRGRRSAYEWITYLWPETGDRDRVASWVLSRICTPTGRQTHSSGVLSTSPA